MRVIYIASSSLNLPTPSEYFYCRKPLYHDTQNVVRTSFSADVDVSAPKKIDLINLIILIISITFVFDNDMRCGVV